MVRKAGPTEVGGRPREGISKAPGLVAVHAPAQALRAREAVRKAPVPRHSADNTAAHGRRAQGICCWHFGSDSRALLFYP